MRLRRRGAAQEDVPSLEEVRSDRQGVAEHYRSTRIVRRRSEGQRARAASCSLSLPLLAAPVSSHSLLARARGRATLSLSGDTLSGDTLSRRARARAHKAAREKKRKIKEEEEEEEEEKPKARVLGGVLHREGESVDARAARERAVLGARHERFARARA